MSLQCHPAPLISPIHTVGHPTKSEYLKGARTNLFGPLKQPRKQSCKEGTKRYLSGLTLTCLHPSSWTPTSSPSASTFCSRSGLLCPPQTVYYPEYPLLLSYIVTNIFPEAKALTLNASADIPCSRLTDQAQNSTDYHPVAGDAHEI